MRILVTPNHIKTASLKAAKHIEKRDYDTLFLNFSRDLEDGIKALAEGAPYDLVFERLKELKLIPELIGAWEYSAKPILIALRGILHEEPSLKTYCYCDPSFALLSAKTAEKIALLIFRACSTGKIDAKKWKILLNSLLDPEAKALEKEINFIARKVESSEDAICIADFNGRHIAVHLRDEGYTVILTYLYTPYHFTPLEILIHEMRRISSRGALSDERITKLVKPHAEFIKKYITMNEDYDEAYRRWICDKAPWLICASKH